MVATRAPQSNIEIIFAGGLGLSLSRRTGRLADELFATGRDEMARR
jgi:hypothetical protein